MTKLGWLCWLPALAARVLAARDPERVESLYARGLYPRIASALARLAGAAPFSLAEVLLLGTGLAAVVALARVLGQLRRGPDRTRTLLAALGAVVAGLGPVYLAFLMLWGFNYQRRPFAASVGLDARPASSQELQALCGG
jgi:hypothetical protein